MQLLCFRYSIPARIYGQEDSGNTSSASSRWRLCGGRVNGDIYFSDWSRGEGYVTIHKVSEGVIHRVAGTGGCGSSRYSRGGETGPALEMCLAVVEDLAFGNNGDLYIADGHYVRKISADGIISHVAGGGAQGSLGDGGPATNAYLQEAHGVAMDSRGNIFVATWNQSRVRKISSAGIITTVAGTGEAGFSDDDEGGPATAARLSNQVADVAIDAENNIYIADRHNYRVRKVTCRPPDLVIESASASGRGRLVNVRVTIANRGEGEAQGPFSIGIRPGGFTKPGFNSVQPILRRGQSLGAEETIERTLRLPAADSMELTIDSGRRVDESDEENNSFSLSR